MRSDRDLLFPASLVLALAATAGLYLRDAPLRAGLGIDAYHHFAAVRELARGEFPPRHNLVPGHHPQGHYGPYLVALGAVARVTGADPVHLLYVAGLLNLAAFAVAWRELARRLLGPGAARWSLLASVLLWGPLPGGDAAWPSRGWPGTTSLADPQNFFYPHQAGLVLLVLTLLLALPREGESRRRQAARWVGAVLAGAVLVATHALAGLGLAAASAALAASGLLARPARPGRAALAAVLPGAALILAALWPYYPVLGLLRAFMVPGLREPPSVARAIPLPTAPAPPAGSMIDTVPSPPPALGPLALLGPASAGAVAVIVLARRQPFLLAWAVANLALAALPVLPLRARMLFFAALPLHLGAAALLESAGRGGRLGRALAIALLALGGVSAAQRIRWLLAQEKADFAFVAEHTPADAVVLADPAISNGVAGLAGRKVVAPQSPDIFLVMAGGWQRHLDVARFLARDVGPEERRAILDRWDATHVLLDRLAPGGPGPLPWPIVHETRGYVLYDARRR